MEVKITISDAIEALALKYFPDEGATVAVPGASEAEFLAPLDAVVLVNDHLIGTPYQETISEWAKGHATENDRVAMAANVLSREVQLYGSLPMMTVRVPVATEKLEIVMAEWTDNATVLRRMNTKEALYTRLAFRKSDLEVFINKVQERGRLVDVVRAGLTQAVDTGALKPVDEDDPGLGNPARFMVSDVDAALALGSIPYRLEGEVPAPGDATIQRGDATFAVTQSTVRDLFQVKGADRQANRAFWRERFSHPDDYDGFNKCVAVRGRPGVAGTSNLAAVAAWLVVNHYLSTDEVVRILTPLYREVAELIERTHPST